MKKLAKRAAALLCVVMLLSSILMVPASADTVWRTGDYGNPEKSVWTSAHDVKLSDVYKDAKIRIHGYTCEKVKKDKYGHNKKGHTGKCKNPKEQAAISVVGWGASVQICKIVNGKVDKVMDNLWIEGGEFKLPATRNSDAYYTVAFRNCDDYQHWAIEGYQNVLSIS